MGWSDLVVLSQACVSTPATPGIAGNAPGNDPGGPDPRTEHPGL